ncbi:UNVERIFIED_CONTAM: hypothetical protein FKN15_057958 [Acipenser sinensis]
MDYPRPFVNKYKFKNVLETSTAVDRPAMQLYQPGARSRTRLGSGGKSYDSSSKSPDRIVDRRFEAATGTGSEKSGEE